MAGTVEPWKERTQLLLGDDKLQLLADATVAVIGLGGVGAYAAEMVARAGVGSMIILDSDVVNETNKNRQLLALDSNIGKSKARVMAQRLLDINPHINLTVIEEYLTEDNIPSVIGSYKIDYLIDAIDTLAPKIALICYCRSSGVRHVSSMGAGAKLDATKIRITDISKSYNCPLAYILRKKLRHKGISKGFKVVFSEELPDREAIVSVEERNKKSQVGTISYLPAVFGCICAQAAICFLIEKH
ncbi:MAG: tRNA threonylcarbamoyladenosine dehydratase [Bacteroidales bacterium]|nr:tRNA threonylcarbamoyladenosine dehydratase [Bacteroidales bacterium]MDD3201505.1 tRNA threonylcarbamoyladenosine dehydratase [Bacteroidales bacterium]